MLVQPAQRLARVVLAGAGDGGRHQQRLDRAEADERRGVRLDGGARAQRRDGGEARVGVGRVGELAADAERGAAARPKRAGELLLGRHPRERGGDPRPRAVVAVEDVGPAGGGDEHRQRGVGEGEAELPPELGLVGGGLVAEEGGEEPRPLLHRRRHRRRPRERREDGGELLGAADLQRAREAGLGERAERRERELEHRRVAARRRPHQRRHLALGHHLERRRLRLRVQRAHRGDVPLKVEVLLRVAALPRQLAPLEEQREFVELELARPVVVERVEGGARLALGHGDPQRLEAQHHLRKVDAARAVGVEALEDAARLGPRRQRLEGRQLRHHAAEGGRLARQGGQLAGEGGGVVGEVGGRVGGGGGGGDRSGRGGGAGAEETRDLRRTSHNFGGSRDIIEAEEAAHVEASRRHVV